MDTSSLHTSVMCHPLLLPPVMRIVNQHLTMWEVKKCRLVCHTWEQISHYYLRAHCQVSLKKVLQDLKTFSSHQRQALSIRRLAELSNSFVIEMEGMGGGLDRSSVHVLRSLVLYSGGIRSLEIISPHHNPWSLATLEAQLGPLLYHLEELTIPIQSFAISSSSDLNLKDCFFPKLKRINVSLSKESLRDLHLVKKCGIECLLEILLKSPYLEEIYYPNFLSFSSPESNPARDLFNNIVQNPHLELRHLSSLKLDTFVTPRDIDALMCKAFPLATIQMTLTPKIQCDTLFRWFLSLRGTLQNLTLTFKDGFRFTQPFPVIGIPRLTHTTIILWNGYASHFGNLKSLKKIFMVLMELSKNMIDTIHEEKIFETVEELDVYGNGPRLNPKIIRSLFPSQPSTLRKLTIDYASDEILWGIYNSFPYLQELVLLYGNYSDFGLTGFKGQETKEKMARGIQDLKDLDTLSIAGELTNFGLVNGVGRSSSIIFLEIIGRFNSQVTDSALLTMVSSLKLQFLKIKDLPLVTAKGIATLKCLLKGIEFHIN